MRLPCVTEVIISSISRNGVIGHFSGQVINEGTQDTLDIKKGSFAIYNYK
jgi:hypothetical protein